VIATCHDAASRGDTTITTIVLVAQIFVVVFVFVFTMLYLLSLSFFIVFVTMLCVTSL
jgi:hypothetical protein